MSEESNKCCNPGDEECLSGGNNGDPLEKADQSGGITGVEAGQECREEADQVTPLNAEASEAVPTIEEVLALLRERLYAKEAQVEELLGRLQRLQADFENYRRRTQREKEETVKTAAASLVETLLPVMDNFQRAAQVRGGDEESFRKGIEMILKQLEKSLGDAGMEAIDAVGHQFDPNFHQAVLMVEEDSYEDNTVIEELQKGYIFGGKVLRPSMVKVSRKSDG